MKDTDDPTSCLISSLDTMRSQGRLCDFAIVTKTKIFPTHRVILAAASDYFQRMFLQQGSLEQYIKFDNIPPKVMQQCIEYLYTSKCNFKLASILTLIGAARFFGIPYLEDDCMKFLKENVTPEYSLEILFKARSLRNLHVQEVVEEVIQTKIEIVMSSRLFPQISKNDLIRFIAKEKHELYWKAVRIYCRGREWIFSELCYGLKIAKFPFEFLYNTVLNDPLTNWKLPETKTFVAKAIFSDPSRLDENINVENFFVLKHLLSFMHDQECKDVMESFMRRNVYVIIAKRGFSSFSKQDVLSLLMSPEVKPEESKWKAILSWIQSDPDNCHKRAKCFRQFFCCIKLDKLTVSVLMQMSQEELVKCDVVCLQMLTQAILRHTDRMLIEGNTTGSQQRFDGNASSDYGILDASEDYERSLNTKSGCQQPTTCSSNSGQGRAGFTEHRFGKIQLQPNSFSDICKR